ncbi:hypothetical protein THASP1DRAFT_8424, partial [Thamnocephalis sphaerospora]
ILWNPSPDPTAPTLGFLQHAVVLLRYFAEHYDLYLMTPVTTLEEKTEVMRLLRDAGLHAAQLDEHKILFCQTSEGVAHLVRHLAPAVHVDADAEIVRMVRTFVGRVVWIRPHRQ